MKILVTGTAGFIGFHLVERLIKEDFEIIGLDSINDYYSTQLKFDRLNEHGLNKESIQYNKLIRSDKYKDYQFIQLKLEDSENISNLFESEKPDIVCNLAAQAGVRYSLENPKAYIDSNIKGFLNILEGCRNNHVKHLLYASSSSVYGKNKKMPFAVTDNVDHPVSLYAASKKSNELMAHTYSHLFNLPTTGFRFFTVYGPWGRPDMAIFIFTEAILKDKPIKVFNNGLMERDFTYVDDIVEGLYNVIIAQPPKSDNNWDPLEPDPSKSDVPYQLYNIGNSKPVKLLDFIDAIEEATGKKAIKELMPIQPGDVEKTWANVENLISDYNYLPNTDVKWGIQQFVDWYKAYYGL